MVYAISLIVLILIFTISTTRPINMGILGFACAFLVGGLAAALNPQLASRLTVKNIIDAFPGDIFLIVVGITLLFAIAKANGTIDVIVASCLRLVRGRRWAIVWMMFLLSGLLMALGSPLAPSMLAPIAMRIAGAKKINPLLMGMALNHGALGAAFSPITIYGAFVSALMEKAKYEANPLILFVAPLALNTAIFAVLFVIFGRNLRQELPADAEPQLAGEGGSARSGPVPGGDAAVAALPELQGAPPLNRDRILTLLGILVLAVAAVGFKIDVGISAFCISAVLLLTASKQLPRIEDKAAWPAVLLTCGMLTYMSVLTMNGTVDFLGQSAVRLGSPLIAALILCYAVALISSVGSSIGTLTIALPLAAPMLATGEVGILGFVVALSFSATVVDVSPFATNGSIVVAAAEVDDRPKFQRQVLAYCGVIVAVAPLLAWALLIVPTSL